MFVLWPKLFPSVIDVKAVQPYANFAKPEVFVMDTVVKFERFSDVIEEHPPNMLYMPVALCVFHWLTSIETSFLQPLKTEFMFVTPETFHDSTDTDRSVEQFMNR